MKNLFKNFLIFLIIFLIIAGISSLINLPENKAEQVSLNNIVQEIQQGKVKEIIIQEDKINVSLINDQHQFAFKEENEPLIQLLKNYGIKPEQLTQISIIVKSTKNKNIWLGTILPFLIPLLIFIGLIYFFSRQMKGAGQQAFKFGESGAKKINPQDKKNKITFKDVAGVKEAKEGLKEIVDFLENPKKYIALGAKIPKGVLLIGPPGCGKTLLARAVAGEANVPFFHISGSEFVEMFVGVGASRVRNLFRKAKKHLPAIIFIDELDAVGRLRGAGLGGGHDEREQTLNQILVELDGFSPNIGLIVMAATNRPDVLDPALLRPGRFDRKVILDMPDIKDRKQILEIHSIKKPLAKNVDLEKIAERTPGFSGADLANLMNEAAILSAKRNKKEIGQVEILESIEKVLLGPERKSHILSKEEKKIVAYHEGGHAVCAYMLPHCAPVRKVSIISRGMAAGYTLKVPEKEKYLHSKSDFLDEITVLLGGYTSEKIFFKEITTGASQDLSQATQIAHKLVTEYGMSTVLGPRTFGEKKELIFLGREISSHQNYSEKIAEIIDEEVSKIINSCYNKAKEILKNNKDKLKKLVAALLKKETVEREEFIKLMKNENKTNP